MPAAEALACGCLVIGYHGQGAKEYFREPYTCSIEDGNIIAFVKAVEKIAMDYATTPQKYLNFMQEGSKKILAAYSPEKEKTDISHAWQIFQERLNII